MWQQFGQRNKESSPLSSPLLSPYPHAPPLWQTERKRRKKREKEISSTQMWNINAYMKRVNMEHYRFSFCRFFSIWREKALPQKMKEKQTFFSLFSPQISPYCAFLSFSLLMPRNRRHGTGGETGDTQQMLCQKIIIEKKEKKLSSCRHFPQQQTRSRDFPQ